MNEKFESDVVIRPNPAVFTASLYTVLGVWGLMLWFTYFLVHLQSGEANADSTLSCALGSGLAAGLIIALGVNILSSLLSQSKAIPHHASSGAGFYQFVLTIIIAFGPTFLAVKLTPSLARNDSSSLPFAFSLLALAIAATHVERLESSYKDSPIDSMQSPS